MTMTLDFNINDQLAAEFHDMTLRWVTVTEEVQRPDALFTYKFQNFFHPYVGRLIEELNVSSLDGLMSPDFLGKQRDDKFFANSYGLPADPNGLVQLVHPIKEIDLVEGGPYSNYNWELLFHFPLAIAVHLSKNQRFAEAQKWFHYIFDPMTRDVSTDPPERFWRFPAFRQANDYTRIDALLELLAEDPSKLTDPQRDLRKKILAGYEAMRSEPFKPHAVARTRRIAYQYSVVMKYLDNLIAWGDHLFRQDTLESINEATQRYVLAANLLGARPQRVPPAGKTRAKSFHEIKSSVQGKDSQGNFKEGGNPFVEMEGQFPFNLGTPKLDDGKPKDEGPLMGVGRTLYFCVPKNDKMLAYWDIVADRLFKIRNSLNIEGVFRALALFDPPIDPGMLVKAAAAGIDVSSIVAGVNQPASPVRSLMLIQKALELCNEVKGMGTSLLGAVEKTDAERMALLRQSHEMKIHEMTQEVRFLQLKQAQDSTESLLRSRASAFEKYRYYQRLLGEQPDPAVADKLPLDRRTLTKDNFDEAYSALVGQYDKAIKLRALPALKLAGSSPSSDSGATGSSKLYLNVSEDKELNVHLPSSRDLGMASSVSDAVASVLVFIPDFNANLQFWGLGATAKVFGGSTISEAAKMAAQIMRIKAAWEGAQAGMVSKTGTYERRAEDWMLQCNLAARELMHFGRQIIGSLIAEQVARHENSIIERQLENSREIDQLLRDKFSNEQLYAWMQGELSRLYYEYYRFAFDTARKAERSMKNDLMRPEVDATDYVRFNYWDGGRKGLLSGEALCLDVKRMELAYHENNKREYELTKHVSLRQLSPLALLQLKAEGSCEVVLPEWLFDLDCSGHYMRRIKSVALSIPAVTGPYTGVNCTLTLLRSSVRKSPLLDNLKYERQGSEDARFVDYCGSTQSIVTSSGANDSGLFETNLRDERVLPFEGAGAESVWRLELPQKFRGFDYNTISDVVLHVRYTARQGGKDLRDKAVDDLKKLVKEANSSGLGLLLSLKHDLSTDWARFVAAAGGEAFSTAIKRDFFPYFTVGHEIELKGVEFHSIQGKIVEKLVPNVQDLTNRSAALKNPGQFTLTQAADAKVPADAKANVFLLLKYALKVS